MKITVIGKDYVSSLSGDLSEEVGIDISFVYIDQKKIYGFNNGQTARIIEAVDQVNYAKKSMRYKNADEYFCGKLETMSFAFGDLPSIRISTICAI